MTFHPQVLTIDNAAWSTADARLSVLIPFLRDDPTDLLASLDAEAEALAGAVEAVVLDDGTNDDDLAQKVADAVGHMRLPARFVRTRINEGRSRGRNRLAANARGGHYLFLDSDMAPDGDAFLAGWLEIVDREDPAVAFGGFTLDLADADPRFALHRAMALRGECRPASVRAKEPQKSLCTSNLLVRASVFAAEGFDEEFKGWGWEDVEWASRVTGRWRVVHVDNTATHLGLDTDQALIAKYEQSPHNFARLAAKHPGIVSAFPSYRLARALKPLPARRFLKSVSRRAALADNLPMTMRAMSTKLYRGLLYAEVVS